MQYLMPPWYTIFYRLSLFFQELLALFLGVLRSYGMYRYRFLKIPLIYQFRWFLCLRVCLSCSGAFYYFLIPSSPSFILLFISKLRFCVAFLWPILYLYLLHLTVSFLILIMFFISSYHTQYFCVCGYIFNWIFDIFNVNDFYFIV